MNILLVDDVRDTDADIICRTYVGAKVVADNVHLNDWRLLLDHDLGPGKSGYDFINYLIVNGNQPKSVLIVSSNPVGRDNIGRALEADGYKRKSPHEFFRRKYESDGE